ncbi:fucose isomerase, partial [Consotaella salsifontis]
KPKIGLAVVGRVNFDVAYAEEKLQKALETLKLVDADFIGEPKILFDADAAAAAVPALTAEPLDLLLILQVTFADATMTLGLTEAVDAPVMMWSFPEPRTGGRLRLNSFCGVNLAAHALSRRGKSIDYVHGEPDDASAAGKIATAAKAAALVRRFKSTKLLVVGEHPDGFDPCDFDAGELASRFGITVDQQPVKAFIEEVKAAPEDLADNGWARRSHEFGNLAEMDEVATRKTLKIHGCLSQRAKDKGYAGIAVRCWPDFFIDYGCAACGALALLNEDRIPAGCEADVYGVITSLLLQWASDDGAVFNSDLVDIDTKDDTVVFWHCGQAPIDMADPEAETRATVHSNRKMPLLSEFPLKPGRITVARLSRSGGKLRLMLAGGEMIRRPLAFSGTAGVARLDASAASYLETIISEGLEHHTAVVYGEHRPVLRAFAKRLGIPVVEMA